MRGAGDSAPYVFTILRLSAYDEEKRRRFLMDSFLANLPFGADFLENNWLIALIVIVGAILYFWLGRSELGLFDLVGKFLK